MECKFEVRKGGVNNRTFGVYAVSADKPEGELVEGGFFSRAAAERCARQTEKDYIDDVVAAAERAAGWDPNP